MITQDIDAIARQRKTDIANLTDYFRRCLAYSERDLARAELPCEVNRAKEWIAHYKGLIAKMDAAQ